MSRSGRRRNGRMSERKRRKTSRAPLKLPLRATSQMTIVTMKTMRISRISRRAAIIQYMWGK